MLVWIKASYAAIGVLASFVLLLSTVVSEQRDLNSTSDDIINTFYAQEEIDSVLIMNLPFAQSLTNPCSWDSSYNGPSQLTFMGPRAKFIQEFFTFVSHYSRIYKEDVQAILRNHTIAGCADLNARNLPDLPDTPTLEKLKEMDMEEALNKIYLSLLVHSAYSFVIHHQVNSSNVRCSHNIQGEQSLANQSYTLALKQKALACNVLVGMTVLGYEKEDVTPLLNVRVSGLSVCSWRALRDCQVMNSAQRFLQELQNYAAEDRKKPSARMLNSASTVASSLTPPSSSIASTSSETSSSSSTLSNMFISSFISTLSTTHTSSTAPISSSTPTSSILSTLLTTSSSLKSTTSSERTSD